MTDHTFTTISQLPDRQLLADFAVASGPGSSRQLLDQVMKSVQELNLQPVQLERIHQAFVQVVARAMPSREPASIYCLHVRIWVLGTRGDDCGWGFFLVEKGDDLQSASTATDHLVELFLYQEGAMR